MHTLPNPQYKLGNNANTLTYIVADESMKNMELGISIAAKKLDIKEPQTVNPPKPVVESKITLDLPSGFTVAPTYKLTGEANKPLILPTEKEITNTTNRKLKGWYIHGENPIKVDSNTRLSEGGVTISPYFEHEEQNYIEALSGKPTKAPDYYDKVSNANNPQSSGLDLKTFSSHLEFINNEESVLLTHQVEFKNDEYIRMLSKANIAIRAGQKYSFKFKLTNKGTEDISFKLAMLQGGTKLDVKDGAVYSDALTIKPNETKETNIEITLINKNSNIMTAILPVTNIHNMNLSIQIFEKEIYDQTEKYTLTLDGTSGVSFNESNTIKLFEGEQLPAIKNTTSREIEGVTYDNKRVKLSDFRMPKKDLTIRPYFKAETGYMRLYSNSGQGNGIPNLCKNGIVETNFEKTCGIKPGYNATFDSSKEVVKLENGFDEEGVRIKYNGEMKTTGEFRTITAPKTSVVAGTHSYKLHYQNNGDERISFDVYFVNSGSDINSCKNNHFELTLDPHQSKTIEVNPTYSKGNGNILMLYKVKADLKNGLNMVLAMSVKYNK